MNAPADTPLAQAVIAQAVQGLESTGWLDDAGALRQAAREKPGERPAQYLRRAWLLGERLGLTQALEQARAALESLCRDLLGGGSRALKAAENALDYRLNYLAETGADTAAIAAL
ncbi:MAG: hypothetical protein ACFNZS_12160, partial [Ottowia sp.]